MFFWLFYKLAPTVHALSIIIINVAPFEISYTYKLQARTETKQNFEKVV